MRFRLVLKSATMTLKCHYALCFKTHAYFGAHHENLNEDRPYYRRRRCSPMTQIIMHIKVAVIGESWGAHGQPLHVVKFRRLVDEIVDD